MAPDVTGLGNGVRSGDGSPDNPYVISSWTVQHDPTMGVQAGGPTILIQDTTAHLVIRDAVVLSSGSPAVAPITIRRASNITLENVAVLGPAPMGAIDLLRADHVVARQIRFGAGDGHEGPVVGFAIGGANLTIGEVVLCDTPDLVRRRAGEVAADFPSSIRIEGVSFAGREPVVAAVPSVMALSVSDAHGPLHIVANLLPGANFVMKDSSARAVEVTAPDVPARTTVSFHNVTIDAAGTCTHDGGLAIRAPGGRVHMAGLKIAGHPQWLASVSADEMRLIESSFNTGPVGEHCTKTGDPALSFGAKCDGPCGDFEFSWNDVFADPGRVAIRFFGESGALRGEANYLGDARVEGNVVLTAPRSHPGADGEAKSLPLPAFLPPLAVVGALLALPVPARSASSTRWFRRPHVR